MFQKAVIASLALLAAGAAIAAEGESRPVPPVGVPRRPDARWTGPDGYGGIQTVTTISSLAFAPLRSTAAFASDGHSLFKYFLAVPDAFGAGLTLPAGAVVDFIGLGSCDPGGGNFSTNLYVQSANGIDFTTVGGVSSSAHTLIPCGVDYNSGELGVQLVSNVAVSLQVLVRQNVGAPTNGTVSVGSVEVWWHTAVSPAPPTPSFNDVPTTDIGFPYIEALYASGITGGCGGGKFCPDNPVTRRQMAIFIAKALGLSWPD